MGTSKVPSQGCVGYTDMTLAISYRERSGIDDVEFMHS